MYPPISDVKLDRHQLAKQRHGLYMIDKAKDVIGRDGVLEEVNSI
jgi:hypothetical protein